MLVPDGMIRAPPIVAAPLLVGVSAEINIVAAGFVLRGGGHAST